MSAGASGDTISNSGVNVDTEGDAPDNGGLSSDDRAMINSGIAVSASLAGLVLGPGTGPLLAGLGGMVFQAFGPHQPSAADYYEALSRQMTQMENTMLLEFHSLSDQLSNVELSIQDMGTKLTLNSDFLNFNDNCNVIDENYSTFIDKINKYAEYSTSDLESSKEAASDIYDLLVNNQSAIKIAMDNIYSVLMDGSETVGLIELQEELVANTVNDWVANTNNYGSSDYSWTFYIFGNRPEKKMTFKTSSCKNIIYWAYPHAVPPVLENAILPFIKTILRVQYRGTMLLTTALGQSGSYDDLNSHNKKTGDIISEIKKVLHKISDPSRIDTVVANAIGTTGFQRVQNSTPVASDGTGGSWTNWVFWDYNGYMLELANIPADFTWGNSYDAVSLAPGWPNDDNLEPGGWPYPTSTSLTLPHPGQQVPVPLVSDLTVITPVLDQASSQAANRRIVMREPPPQPSGGQVWARIEGLPAGTNATALHAHVLEYLADKTWKAVAYDISIGPDGSFFQAVEGDGAVFWMIVIAGYGWRYNAGNGGGGPDIGSDVVAYTTVMPSRP